MRLTMLSAIILAFVMGAAFGQQRGGAKWVQPTKDGTGIYKSEIRQPYEQPAFTADATARMEVLETTKEHFKIRLNGQVGWVEKRLVTAASRGSRTFMFEDAEVIGYLDNPTPVYIIDAADQDRDPIKLDRSFADALKENVDKETVERQSK
jgi:hypothetical protein